MDVLKELQPIFQDIFDDDLLVLSNEMSADAIEDWDSLVHVRLIAAIQKHFDIKFAFDEILELRSVGEMVKHIEEKLRQ